MRKGKSEREGKGEKHGKSEREGKRKEGIGRGEDEMEGR